MQLTLATAPTCDPVSLTEVREWLNIVDGITESDAVVERLIDEAYEELEKYTNRKICTQTWTLTLDAAEVVDPIRLPLVPLVSVSSIVTTDDDGDASTMTSSYYRARAGENPRIVLTSTGSWATDMRDHDACAITAVCGYNGTKVPYVGFEPAAYNSPGLNDLTASLSAAWTGTAKTTYEIVIDAAATTDTFKWRAVTRDADGQKTHGAWTATVSITGAAQALASNAQIKFAATTGHTLNDKWTVQMYERLPEWVRQALRALVIHWYVGKGRGVTETVSGQLISLPHHVERRILSYRVEAV